MSAVGRGILIDAGSAIKCACVVPVDARPPFLAHDLRKTMYCPIARADNDML